MKAPLAPGSLRFSSLSPARQRLVDVLRRLRFGRIEHLCLSAGDPQFDQAPTIIQTIKLPADASVKETFENDFILKRQFVELFEWFDQYQTGVILRLEVRFSLPLVAEIKVCEEALIDAT